MPRPPLERLLARAEERAGCLIFTGRCNKAGYGRVHVSGRGPVLAHRLMWEHHRGPIPAGLELMHICDHPPCVELSHLRLGTHAENMADMKAKGRAARMLGSDNVRTKLSDSQVRQARVLADLGYTRTSIGALFGVHPAHISRLVRGQRRETVG